MVPSPRISFPVEKVKFVTGSNDKILTLCEVFIFGGEYSCRLGLIEKWQFDKKQLPGTLKEGKTSSYPIVWEMDEYR